MPFTPAHAVAVLPLRRLPLSFPALVAGSFAPDAPYYLYALDPPIEGEDTHDLVGIVIYALPTALVLLLLWHVTAVPLLALAPAAVRRRLAGRLPGVRWSWVVLPSAWLGALTHIAWDHWTHDYGWFVGQIDGLRQTVTGTIEVYAVLQQLSTVGGLTVLAIWLTRKFRRMPVGADVAAPVPSRVRTLVLAATVSLAVLLAVVYALEAPEHSKPLRQVKATLTSGTEGLVAGLVVGLLAYSVLWRIVVARRSPGSRVDDDQPGSG